MKIVKPFAELWTPDDIEKHIVRCAQICYAAEKIPINIHAWLEAKWTAGHKSIFRHGTYYFVIPVVVCTEMMRSFFKNNPYIGYYENKEFVFCSVNGQTYRETPWFNHLYRYSTSELGLKGFINNEDDKNGITKILRRTLYIQTQISTSRELNRVSPNNICEQSTRYCNYTINKFDGEVKICEPWWFNDDFVINQDNFVVNGIKQQHYLRAIEIATNVYKELIESGMKPQDARGVLPLDTATKCVYTYRMEEWAHILDLRYYGKTGTPHPNAKIIANMIRLKLNDSLPEYQDATWSDCYFPEKTNLDL